MIENNNNKKSIAFWISTVTFNITKVHSIKNMDNMKLSVTVNTGKVY